jgi:hypothetical protein
VDLEAADDALIGGEGHLRVHACTPEIGHHVECFFLDEGRRLRVRAAPARQHDLAKGVSEILDTVLGHQHVVFVQNLDQGIRHLLLEFGNVLVFLRLANRANGFPVAILGHGLQALQHLLVLLHLVNEFFGIDGEKAAFAADAPDSGGVRPMEKAVFQPYELALFTERNPDILALGRFHDEKGFVDYFFLGPNHLLNFLLKFGPGVAVPLNFKSARVHNVNEV